jgi:hypothetical protein
VNPDHLFLGTHKDNIEDCNNKGRRNQYRKLPEKVRAEVRYLYAGGDYTYEALATTYNVSTSLIGNIINEDWS